MSSRPRSAEPLRTGIGAALTAIGALLLAVLPLLHWTDARLADEDGFVEAVAGVAGDTAVQEDFIGSALDRGLQGTGLPGSVTGWLSEQLDPAVSGFVASDGYQDVWSGVARQIHRQLLQPGTQEIGVDVSDLVQTLVDRVDLPIGFDLEIPDGWELTLAEYRRPAALGWLQGLGPALPGLQAAGIAACALGVLIAPRVAGRGATLVVGGGTAVLGAVVSAVAVGALADLLPTGLAESPPVALIVEALAADARADVLPAAALTLGYGTAVAVVGVLVMVGAAVVTGGRRESGVIAEKAHS